MDIGSRSFWIALVLISPLANFILANDCSQDSPELESISGESGSFTIPLLAMNWWRTRYRNNRLCMWQIMTPPNTIAHVRFDNMNIENPIWNVCLYDHVTVMDPETGRAEPYCGQPDTPPTFHASGNVLDIAFSSDGSVGKSGFTAQYWSTPADTTTSTTTSTTTTSTTTTTASPPTTTTLLTTTTSVILASLTTTTASTTTASTTSSSSTSSTTSSTSTSTTASAPEPSRCSGSSWSVQLTANSGILGTEGSQYNNNQDCTWTIEAPVGMRVLLEFEAFELEYESSCRYDSLDVYNADGTPSDKKLAALCGSTAPLPITTSDRYMTLRFNSDSSIQKDGFTATYSFINPGEEPCSGLVELSGSTGTLSLGESIMYTNYAYCPWIITVPSSETIQLDFEYIAIESHSSCAYDRLSIYDGPDASSPLLTTQCGDKSSFTISSTGNTLSLVFTSDQLVTDRGFKATYTSVPSGPTTTSTTSTVASTTTGPTTTSSTSGEPSCGVRGGPSRIVGGTDAAEGSWPWQVSLQYFDNFHFCGGSIIDSNWVVTAAHCTNGKSAGSFKVVVGAHNLPSNDGQSILVAEVINHESYNTGAYLLNDISLLRLATSITFNDEVSPVCLPTEDIAPSSTCYITGWGTLSSGGVTPDILQEAPVTVLTNTQCSANGYGSSIKDSMVCAGAGPGDDTLTDSCQGDSGGPMMCGENGVYKLHGLTSWGYGCASPVYRAGVYTRVFSFVDWIEAKMGQ